ncbi:hypothetical protein JW930_03160 [Candidatus Woesearchaeota archaeon]|nr:hypothetical protein [Candidatus Woesearchaeota archaeon]
MKKIKTIFLLTFLLLVLKMTLADPIQDANTYLDTDEDSDGNSDVSLDIVILDTGLSYDYDTGAHTLSVELSGKTFILHLESFVNSASNELGFLSTDYPQAQLPDYAFNKIFILVEEHNSVNAPKIVFGIESSGGEPLVVASVQAVSDDITHIYFGKQDPSEEDTAKVYLVQHDRDGTPYLTLISNKKSSLILENNGIKSISYKQEDGGETKVSVFSLLRTGFLSLFRESDILSFDTNKVFELVSVGRYLQLWEYSFEIDESEDRYYSVDQGEALDIYYDNSQEWTEHLSSDFAVECSEQEQCNAKYHNQGEIGYTCLCTRIDNDWLWRKEDYKDCNGQIIEDKVCCCDTGFSSCSYTLESDCEDNIIDEQEYGSTNGVCTPDITVRCCLDPDLCDLGTIQECNKMGFMVLLLDGIESQNYFEQHIQKVQEFAGNGGWVLDVGIVTSSQPQQYLIDFVEESYDNGLTPIVRMLGSGWDMTPLDQLDAEMFANYANNLYEETNGKSRYIQLLNEPNLVLGEDDANPTGVAQFIIDVSNYLKNDLGNDNIYIISPGLSPGVNDETVTTPLGESRFRKNTLDYIAGLFSVSGFAQAIDIWGYHSYATGGPEENLEVCDDSPTISEYSSTVVCEGGMLGYRYELNYLIEEEYITEVYPVLITETGYGEAGSMTPTLIAQYMQSSYLDYWYEDPYVQGTIIFVLNDPTSNNWINFEWYDDNGGTLTNPKSYYEEIRDQVGGQTDIMPMCGEFGLEKGQIIPIGFGFELDCSSPDKGSYSLTATDQGVDIEVEMLVNGDEGTWELVYRKLSCDEMKEDGENLGFGMIYVQVFDIDGSPLSNVDVAINTITKTTGVLEDHPVCLASDEPEEAGYVNDLATFSLGEEDIYEVFVLDDEFNYRTYKKAIFTVNNIEQVQCGTGQNHLPSYSLRFYAVET